VPRRAEEVTTITDKIRESVSRTYTRAVRGSGSCIAPTCCDDAIAIPKGEAAKVAGYGDDDLGSLPADAVENAFGCWVISNCVISLSPEKPRVFAEIARVLKPGATRRSPTSWSKTCRTTCEKCKASTTPALREASTNRPTLMGWRAAEVARFS